ncbi:hypothetical protein [Aquimarina sp. 2201CG5-10]|uniref:hypothetical protein n=1 Tax=Aquimarina callyspongiae TaxID=3098150 RepID=UPI002AB53FAE|nr:hypothetical protein [Aquimarina sp. 2201CG5-10]MDY8136095.1 hypothetical protein [Aquimarina sp. 2201CG5-10]
MKSTNKAAKKRRFADFQNSYRRSSNFGYGSKRDQFPIAGDGELSISEEEKSRNASEKSQK